MPEVVQTVSPGYKGVLLISDDAGVTNHKIALLKDVTIP